MKTLSKTTILLLIAVALVVALGGAYMFFFVVMKNKTSATEEILVKIEELSSEESRLISAVAVLRSENANIEKLSTYFVRESEIVAFAKKIEALESQSGATVSLESLDPGVTEKTIPYLNFRIKAKGKFGDIERLLVLLENFPGKFEWKTIRLFRDVSLLQQGGGVAIKTSSSEPEWNAEIFITALNFIRE